MAGRLCDLSGEVAECIGLLAVIHKKYGSVALVMELKLTQTCSSQGVQKYFYLPKGGGKTCTITTIQSAN